MEKIDNELLNVVHSQKLSIGTNYIRRPLIDIVRDHSDNEFIPYVDTSVNALLESGVTPSKLNYTGDDLIDIYDTMNNKHMLDMSRIRVEELQKQLEVAKNEFSALNETAPVVENVVENKDS